MIRHILLFFSLVSAGLHSQTVTILNENWSSNSFATNGWTFPFGSTYWQLATFYLPQNSVAPAVIFWPPVSPAISNYSTAIQSKTLNASSISGPVFFSAAVRLQHGGNTSGTELFRLEYKTTSSSTWTTITTYTNISLGGVNAYYFPPSTHILPGVSGQIFEVRFVAHGASSNNFVAWAIDDVLIYGVTCPTSLPSLTITPGTTVCAGASVTLTAVGGGPSYTWSPSGGNSTMAVVSPTTTTPYALISSYPGCSTSPVSAVTTITVINSSTTLNAISSASAICAGETVTLSASGASSYTWNQGPGAATFALTPTITTNYSVTSTNSLGCNNHATVNVVVFPPPAISAFSSPTAICMGSSANLIATGAPSYTWNTGANNAIIVVTPTTSSTYSITGESTDGCLSTATVYVNVSSPITVQASNSLICPGASVTINASGANTYTWNNGTNGPSIVQSPTANTSYSVTGEDINGCISSANALVGVDLLPTVTVTQSAVQLCAGDSLYLFASGATTYSWSNSAAGGTIIVTPTTASGYTVTGSSLAGCTGPQSTKTLSISVLPLPAISVSATQLTICAGQTTSLQAGGAIRYHWNNGDTLQSIAVQPTVSSTFTVTGTNTSNCSAQGTISINVISAPSLSLSVTAPSVCAGNTIGVTVSGATSYSWNGLPSAQSFTILPLSTANYSLSAPGNGTCISSKTIMLSVYPIPTVSISGKDSICANELLTLIAGGATDYLWSTNGTGSLVILNPQSSTVYSVQGSLGGCSSSATIQVTVKPLPNLIAFPDDTTVCLGQGLLLQASGADTYLWNGSQNSSSLFIIPLNDTLITVTGKNLNGCGKSEPLRIVVEDCTGFIEKADTPQFNVFPNPASDIVWLSCSGDVNSIVDAMIIDAQGRVVTTFRYSFSTTHKLNVSHLPQGIYQLKIPSSQGVLSNRLLINR